MQPRLLLPLAAAALVFAAPTAANAAVTTNFQGTTLTLTGDGAADTINVLANSAGQLTHNLGGDATDFDLGAGVLNLPSDGTIAVVVNAGGGNDTINLSAPNANSPVEPRLAAATINGEADDDVIVGSAAVDTIQGGDGNDRITGFRGNDQVRGGNGNDVMIWNNGDGTDLNDGEGNADETLITTGAANDPMTVKASATGFRFDRNTVGPFGIDMVAVEKLTITSFSGNDTLATDAGVTLPMTIDAGAGDDVITTGDGADLINGGDGNDTLNGAGGGDRIVGDRGGDTMNAGAGDDTMVWNNGDGSDVMNGDAGVDRVEDNLSGGTDVSTLRPDNGRIRYDRTNVGQFSLSIATSEVFELNSLGGDDVLTTSPGVAIPVIADGGAGNDAFNVRENEPGFYFGGDGADTAVVDADDAALAIEAVDRPAVAQPPAPGAGTIVKTAKVKKNVASVKVSCPAGTAGCIGYVTLLHKSREVGRVPYTLNAGQSKTLKIKLARNLTKKKSLTVKARTSSRAARDKESRLKLSFR